MNDELMGGFSAEQLLMLAGDAGVIRMDERRRVVAEIVAMLRDRADRNGSSFESDAWTKAADDIERRWGAK